MAKLCTQYVQQITNPPCGCISLPGWDVRADSSLHFRSERLTKVAHERLPMNAQVCVRQSINPVAVKPGEVDEDLCRAGGI